MAVDVQIRETKDADISYVVSNCRNADLIEFQYASDEPIISTVFKMKKTSHRCFTGVIDGEIVCVFGIIPEAILSSCRAFPWMICAKSIEHPKNRKVLVEKGLNLLEELSKGYKSLLGVVHEQNSLAIRWLKYIGFVVETKDRHEINGGGFHRFHMEGV